ncbi:MAG TPA: L,D-transpeptidase, partial [Thermomicrobiales bacterium]|nr:L,D-transpeptidase [Thermomicrobiales bacterium]
LTAPKALSTVSTANWDLSVWEGAALSETNVRQASNTKSKEMKTLEFGDPVVVVEWVAGEEVYEGANIWGKLKDGTFVYARNVGRHAPVAATPIPGDAPTYGKWIDINLTQQLMVAYDGTKVARVSVMTAGMPGHETPTGYFAINSRVANETMKAGTPGADGYYNLANCLFTQYFTEYGHAIHFAWWRTPETIGRPGSHGCINLLLDESQFYWDWATIGTPVIVHK